MLRGRRRSSADERNFPREEPGLGSAAVQTWVGESAPPAVLLPLACQSERPLPSREGAPGRKDPPACRRPPFSWSPSPSSL
ncbi:PREDICTED: ethanolamine kinase 1-like [Ceratotherium simum simum]|uniref:Ethanolamine kinase 1-like n=1 Tax=Ceratotherium simum simum TaxID=73337 RepID=A0ABM1D4X6_CERSS|nr:PREDICTED: ethanolamine kinase 1-like [Ceratotherium simum simum]